HGAIRGGKTDYGAGIGFFLGYSGTAYKIDIGSSSQYLRWDGSSLNIAGNIVVTGGSIPYSFVTGGPPIDADNTATVISGGLITTGRIELGSPGNVKAGIDGAGTSDSDIRFWAGATYESRALAPFRVTQGGQLVATSATITGGVLGGANVVTITPTGLDVGPYGSIRGGKTGYGSGTGFFLGYSGGTYRLDIGSSSQYLRWDGSTLYVQGRIVAQPGSSISGNYIQGGTVRANISTSTTPPYVYTSGGALNVYSDPYNYLQLTPNELRIYTGYHYVYLTVDSLYSTKNGFTLESPGNLNIKCGSHSYLTLPGGTNRYLRYDGPLYTGGFLFPAGGIYIYIGGSRYAIPYYGPV
ncbi:MAG: hypothetical protein QXX12_01720, partial [Nanopusillaceae archaeon]